MNLLYFFFFTAPFLEFFKNYLKTLVSTSKHSPKSTLAKMLDVFVVVYLWWYKGTKWKSLVENVMIIKHPKHVCDCQTIIKKIKFLKELISKFDLSKNGT